MSPAVSVHFLQTQSDARLLALARGGHERAFEALVHRYRKSLLAYCRRLLLPEARAEDAVQQALLQAWIALERGDEVRDARAWLFRITHNAALNALRGSRYDYAQLSESLAGDRAPEDDLDRRVAIREALAGLAALPPLQREALLRTAVEGRRHEEVAAAMGLSDAALRGLVYRARTTLRSAVTAITPPSLVAWVASAGAHSGSFAERFPEVSAGGGSAGIVAVLLKGGTVAVTAGALVVGASAVHGHHATALHRHKTPQSGTSAAGLPDSQSNADAALANGSRPSGAHGHEFALGLDSTRARGRRLDPGQAGPHVNPANPQLGSGRRDDGSHGGAPSGGPLVQHEPTSSSGDHHSGDHGTATQSPTGSHDGGSSGGATPSGTSGGGDGGTSGSGSTSGTSGLGSTIDGSSGSGSGSLSGSTSLASGSGSHDGGLVGSPDPTTTTTH